MEDKTKEFKEIKVLLSQVAGGTILKDPVVGFYNFEKLEALLVRNGFMTAQHEGLISIIRDIFRGSETERDEMLDTAAERFRTILGLENKYDKENTNYSNQLLQKAEHHEIRAIIRNATITPSCLSTIAWFEWYERLKHKSNPEEKFTTILSIGDWRLRLANYWKGLQIYKEFHANHFLSVLGPRLDFGGEHCAIFEYCYVNKDHIDGMIYQSYPETCQAIKEKHLLELPTEKQIEQKVLEATL